MNRMAGSGLTLFLRLGESGLHPLRAAGDYLENGFVVSELLDEQNHFVFVINGVAHIWRAEAHP